MAPKSQTMIPQIPAELVDKIKSDFRQAGSESLVYDANFHTRCRLHLCQFGERLAHPDQWVEMQPDVQPIASEGAKLSRPPRSWPKELKRTYMHIAADLGDNLLACEMIRAGAIVDFRDSDGNTALTLAMVQMSGGKKRASRQLVIKEPILQTMARNYVYRYTFLVRILLEQHADPNVVVQGMTPLHYACIAQDWDIITLLLEHGASSNPPLGSTVKAPAAFLPPTSRSRFIKLAQSFANKPRPLRLCPCFSGLTTVACHEEGKPYPPDFYCHCGSEKTHKHCCGRSADKVSEKWNNTTRKWEYVTKKKCITPVSLGGDGGATEAEQEAYRQIGDFMSSVTQDEFAQLVESGFNPFQAMHEVIPQGADDLMSKGLIDPAFGYAMKKLVFFPRPQRNHATKADRMFTQKAWNDTIDQYIRSGLDDRPKKEIERAAKIGPSNGALYRTCYGENCTVTEGRDVQKLEKCGNCRIAVYCSHKCQKSRWKVHKAVCGSDTQTEQALPSQKAVHAYVNAKSNEIMQMADSTIDPNVQHMQDILKEMKMADEGRPIQW